MGRGRRGGECWNLELGQLTSPVPKVPRGGKSPSLGGHPYSRSTHKGGNVVVEGTVKEAPKKMERQK